MKYNYRLQCVSTLSLAPVRVYYAAVPPCRCRERRIQRLAPVTRAHASGSTPVRACTCSASALPQARAESRGQFIGAHVQCGLKLTARARRAASYGGRTARVADPLPRAAARACSRLPASLSRCQSAAKAFAAKAVRGRCATCDCGARAATCRRAPPRTAARCRALPRHSLLAHRDGTRR
jgi:hypothetical protein